jgi:hypothetical protein
MNVVEPIHKPRDSWCRPYVVKVNGKILMTRQRTPRRFKDSKSAAIAGAYEVDRLRAAGVE